MYDVITFGSATRDVFMKSPAFKIFDSPEFLKHELGCFVMGSKVEVEDVMFGTGGGATNAAASFGVKGVKVACVASVGNDLNAEAVKLDLAEHGATSEFLQVQQGKQTDYSVILHAPSGERTILNYKGASLLLDTAQIPFDKLESRWFYLSSFSGNTPLLEKVFEHARAKHIRVAFNPGARELKASLDGFKKYFAILSVLLLNREEAAQLAGKDEATVDESARAILELYKGVLVITDGRSGVSVFQGRNIWRAGTFKERAVLDRTGAGDAFGSGFVYGLMTGGEPIDRSYSDAAIREAVRIGSANATSVVEIVGAKNGLLTKEQLNDPRWNGAILNIQQSQL